ncbi:adenosylhomocysteinase [Leucobacter viscericola]|uniref:adenosylhomocysteinase n=1 Tax=Leucobacter viscericola TaxID=2714935 RepID=UPI001FCC4742|nr:adenosylhomocysteinase [Leucobacter viscericola]
MTEPHEVSALKIERAVRAAARAGNRLLSGGRARVRLADPAQQRECEIVLARMGARLTDDAAVAEFEFVDELDAEGKLHDGARVLPPVTVALSGEVRSFRGESAERRINWAAQGMPVTAYLATLLGELQKQRGETLAPPRIAVSLVLEPKTAALTFALADAGCEVALFSAVSETDPEVARAVADDGRVAVFAPISSGDAQADAREQARIDAEHAAAVLDWGADYLIDDGSHLIRLAHTERAEALLRLRGAAEETTSGVRPLLEMVDEGSLRIPVIAVNNARTKMDFDNLIGTGQSCVFAIADALEAHAVATGSPYGAISGARWVVIGYGPVGVGVARFAAALGAHVTVVERDPVRALSALHDGFEAGSTEQALPTADVVVSATGVWHTVTAAGFELLRAGAVVAVAGGIDDELAIDDLAAAGWRVEARSEHSAEWISPGADRGVIVLAGGGGVNYSASEGNPIEVMDLSFATQLAALIRLMGEDLAPGVHPILTADEDLVARTALTFRGGSADPAPTSARPGGAAQPWQVHRYRAI